MEAVTYHNVVTLTQIRQALTMHKQLALLQTILKTTTPFQQAQYYRMALVLLHHNASRVSALRVVALLWFVMTTTGTT
jgi:hypothetical protein